MSFCSKCGTEVAEDLSFCGKCGYALKGGQADAAAVQTGGCPEPNQGGSAGTNQSNQEKLSDKWAWMLAFAPALGMFFTGVIQGATGSNEEWISFLVFFILNTAYFCLDSAELKKNGREASQWWWIVLIPVYLFLRAGKNGKKYGYAITWCMFFVITLLLDGAGAEVSGDPSYVNGIKNGYLESCPNHTVGEMVESFMGNPKWEHGVTADGDNFVNIRGKITLLNKPVNGLLQLWIKKDGSFGFQAFEINDVPQTEFMAIELLSNMCEAAEAARPGGKTSTPAAAAESKASASDGNRDSRLVGKWEAEMEGCINFNFKKDGALSIEFCDWDEDGDKSCMTGTGTWRTDGNVVTMTLTVNGSTDTEKKTYRFEGNALYIGDCFYLK